MEDNAIMETKEKKRKQKSSEKEKNWAIDPETGKKVHKRWLAFIKATKNPGTIVDMKAVLK